MIVDLHNHTRYCRHATGACEEYVAAAESNGCRVFAFSGHLPYPPDFSEPEPDCVIPEEDFPAYLEEVARLRRADPQAMLVLAAV